MVDFAAHIAFHGSIFIGKSEDPSYVIVLEETRKIIVIRDVGIVLNEFEGLHCSTGPKIGERINDEKLKSGSICMVCSKMPHLPKYIRDAAGREFKLKLFIDHYGRPHYRYVQYKFTLAEKVGLVFKVVADGFRF
jgi:hypothetical protein